MTVTSATERIPEPLHRFIAQGGAVFRCDDGDWEVGIEFPPPAFLQRALSPDSLIIANNGCGDYLFLKSRVAPNSEPGSFENRVFVYRHEGAEIEQFSDDLEMLTHPPASIPSDHSTVFYADGAVEVRLGDHVSARNLFFRKEGRVVYVPGVSRRNREFEHGGLLWVGIRFEGGSVTGVFVDPNSLCLKKSLRFLSRSTSGIEEIDPLESLK